MYFRFSEPWHRIKDTKKHQIDYIVNLIKDILVNYSVTLRDSKSNNSYLDDKFKTVPHEEFLRLYNDPNKTFQEVIISTTRCKTTLNDTVYFVKKLRDLLPEDYRFIGDLEFLNRTIPDQLSILFSNHYYFYTRLEQLDRDQGIEYLKQYSTTILCRRCNSKV